jgi:hypothetical protein
MCNNWYFLVTFNLTWTEKECQRFKGFSLANLV